MWFRGERAAWHSTVPTEDHPDSSNPSRPVNVARLYHRGDVKNVSTTDRSKSERLMFNTDGGSRTRRATGMRPIPATAAIAAAIVSVLAITPPAFARSETGGAGHVSGTDSSRSLQPSYSPSRATNVNSSGAHNLSGSGSPRQFSSSGGREDWHSGSTPPGWTAHGEKRGWDGVKMPPGLSHRDRDPQWHDRQFDRGDEGGDREHAQFHPGRLERR